MQTPINRPVISSSCCRRASQGSEWTTRQTCPPERHLCAAELAAAFPHAAGAPVPALTLDQI